MFVSCRKISRKITSGQYVILTGLQQPPKLMRGRPRKKVMTVKKKKGGGGAMRAFFHLRSQHKGKGRPDFKKMHQEYRALNPAEKQHFERLGTAATHARRATGTAFPKTQTSALRLAEAKHHGTLLQADEPLFALHLEFMGHPKHHPNRIQ